MAEEKKEAEGGEAAPAPKKRLDPMLLALGGQLLLVIAAAAGTAYGIIAAKKVKLNTQQLQERAIASIKDDLQSVQTLPLEEFQVNRVRAYTLKTKIDVEVSNPVTASLIRSRMSAVRARVLQFLYGQSKETLKTTQGKLLIKEGIRDIINSELEDMGEKHGVVRDVYFLEFILI